MSFNWEDYIFLSQKMIDENEEAYFRTAISRAYYGAFCIARNIKGFKDKTSKVHQNVISAYKNSNNLIDQKIGKNLDELRKSRNKSDYQEDEVIKKSHAERMVILAKSVLRQLKGLNINP